MEDDTPFKPTQIDPKILEELISIDKQIEVVLKVREEENKQWKAAKLDLIQRGYTHKEADKHRSEYITKKVSKELHNLRCRRFYYRSEKRYHKAYYQKKRGFILEKYHQEKDEKKNTE